MAAVKLLVIDAIRNTVSASGRRSSPSRHVPAPPVWTSSPPRITPQATPGIFASSRCFANFSSIVVSVSWKPAIAGSCPIAMGACRAPQAGSTSSSRIRLLIRPLDS